MKYLTILVFVLLLCACVPLTEEQRYDREDALLVAQGKFAIDKRACQAVRGVMVFHDYLGSFDTRKLSVWDYRHARCLISR